MSDATKIGSVVFPFGGVAGVAGPPGPAGPVFVPAYTPVALAYVVLSTDYTVDCTAGTFAVTLLTAVGIAGQIFNVKNSGGGTISIATTAGQTIDGNASGAITLTQYDNLTVQSNGANWIIL